MADRNFRLLSKALPETEQGVRDLVAAQPFVTVICPICRTGWDRLGSTVPPDFDAICPECWDRGARPGRREIGHSRPDFLADAGFPVLLRQEFRERAPETAPKATAFPGLPSPLDWLGEPWCIGLVGPTRTGKSMLLAELAWRLRARFRSPFFVRADRLVSALFGRLGDAEREKHYGLATTAPLLVLDDLGWGTAGGAMDKIFEVIAERHSNRLATAWSSNTFPRDLVQTNPPMARRIMEGPIFKFEERHEWITEKGANRNA